MTTKVQVRSIESEKVIDQSCKIFSRQRMQATENLVQLRLKFKFGRSKFKSLILHVQIKNSTARIKSERLDQMHLMLQRL